MRCHFILQRSNNIYFTFTAVFDQCFRSRLNFIIEYYGRALYIGSVKRRIDDVEKIVLNLMTVPSHWDSSVSLFSLVFQ